MITIIKLGADHTEKFRYMGKLLQSFTDGVIIEAYWTLPMKDLGYTQFENGDRFVEYYYRNQWFNIFEITGKNGLLKGWYCNITEPAQITKNSIAQVDLFLDVWVQVNGTTLLLDEEEFANATLLTKDQRQGAREGQQKLLGWIDKRLECFVNIQQ